jgi:hypothetical protein
MATLAICLYRQCPRANLDCACTEGHYLGARRTMERQLRRHVSRSLSHAVSADSSRQGGSATIAPRSESPGSAKSESRLNAPGASTRTILMRLVGGPCILSIRGVKPRAESFYPFGIVRHAPTGLPHPRQTLKLKPDGDLDSVH